MTAATKVLLNSFERLSRDEQCEITVEILRRTTQFDLPALTDDMLVACAEDVFLALDREDVEYGQTKTR